jgi:hypothetical protein
MLLLLLMEEKGLVQLDRRIQRDPRGVWTTKGGLDRLWLGESIGASLGPFRIEMDPQHSAELFLNNSLFLLPLFLQLYQLLMMLLCLEGLMGLEQVQMVPNAGLEVGAADRW